VIAGEGVRHPTAAEEAPRQKATRSHGHQREKAAAGEEKVQEVIKGEENEPNPKNLALYTML
jgi:hypothetical protein